MIWYSILVQLFGKKSKLNKFWEELTAYFPFITYKIFLNSLDHKEKEASKTFLLLHVYSLPWDHVYWDDAYQWPSLLCLFWLHCSSFQALGSTQTIKWYSKFPVIFQNKELNMPNINTKNYFYYYYILETIYLLQETLKFSAWILLCNFLTEFGPHPSCLPTHQLFSAYTYKVKSLCLSN
jgi:hypothetical protein